MTDTIIARRLAAILAADVVDYSRLMGTDEDATMTQWWDYRREVIDPGISQFGGRIVKHTGDGFLAEFASAFDAVNCALSLQEQINERGEKIVGDKRVRFRMGVNLCDIMSDAEDIYGDGVNIAARIEALAAPGRVYVSGSVYEQIRSKPDFECIARGEHALKNIAEPVRVFDVNLPGQTAPQAVLTKVSVPLVAANEEERPSIAVLPFDNMSGDAEQSYFADGITEDLITDLSKVSGLLVIARNSVFTYKGKAVNVPEVCKELGVQWALEGSVRKSGNRVRVTAQLIDGATGGHLWADRYDRDLDDIFAVQDEVTAEIISALKVKISAREKARMTHRSTNNVKVYDIGLRARELIIGGTEVGMREARVLIQQTLEADPGYAEGIAGMAFTYLGQFVNQWGVNHQTALTEAEKWAEKAIAADPEEVTGWGAVAAIRTWQNRLDEARDAISHVLEISPNSMDGRRLLGNIENFEGNPETSVKMLEECCCLDPHGPAMNQHSLGQAHFALEHWDKAAELFQQRIELEPDTDSSYVLLASTLGHLGREAEALQKWKQVFSVKPDYSLAERSRLWPFKNPDFVEKVYAGLEKAGIDPGPR